MIVMNDGIDTIINVESDCDDGDIKNQEAAANDLVLHAYHGWSGF
jgi:hypothetical protein